MSLGRKNWRKSVAVTAMVAFALSPSVVLAALASDAADAFGRFTPAGVDSLLAQHFNISQMQEPEAFAFTPSVSMQTDRTVTIVVRAPKRSAQSFAKMDVAPSASAKAKPVETEVKLAATSYDLGRAKGIQSFAVPAMSSPVKSKTPLLTDLNGASSYSIDDTSKKRKGIAPRIRIEEPVVAGARRDLTPAGNDYRVDVGGSLPVTKGIAMTAGVVIETKRDPMQRLTDATPDSQAVYVGTRIKF